MSYEPCSREALEDALVGARDMARMARGQYDAFIEAGFPATDALRLTQTWLAAIVGGGMS